MIIGNGSKNELEEYISSYNLRNKVKLLQILLTQKHF